MTRSFQQREQARHDRLWIPADGAHTRRSVARIPAPTSEVLANGKSAQRHRAAKGGLDINVVQFRRVPLEGRRRLHDEMILVQLREQGGNLALAESVVKRLIDLLRGNAEARGGDAVDDQTICMPSICWSVARSRNSGSARNLSINLSRPKLQFGRIRVFQGVLILGPADAVFNGHILHRLHEKSDVVDFGQFAAAGGG